MQVPPFSQGSDRQSSTSAKRTCSTDHVVHKERKTSIQTGTGNEQVFRPDYELWNCAFWWVQYNTVIQTGCGENKVGLIPFAFLIFPHSLTKEGTLKALQGLLHFPHAFTLQSVRPTVCMLNLVFCLLHCLHLLGRKSTLHCFSFKAVTNWED